MGVAETYYVRNIVIGIPSIYAPGTAQGNDVGRSRELIYFPSKNSEDFGYFELFTRVRAEFAIFARHQRENAHTTR